MLTLVNVKIILYNIQKLQCLFGFNLSYEYNYRSKIQDHEYLYYYYKEVYLIYHIIYEVYT